MSILVVVVAVIVSVTVITLVIVVPVIRMIVLMVGMARYVTRFVFCRSNEIHRPIACVVLMAVLAPILRVPRGHV
jgi:hypothetical protein